MMATIRRYKLYDTTTFLTGSSTDVELPVSSIAFFLSWLAFIMLCHIVSDTLHQNYTILPAVVPVRQEPLVVEVS